MLGLLWHKEKLRGIKLIKCSNYLGLSRTKRDLGGQNAISKVIFMQKSCNHVEEFCTQIAANHEAFGNPKNAAVASISHASFISNLQQTKL